MAKKQRLNYKLISLVLFVAIIVILQVKFNAYDRIFSGERITEKGETDIVVATVNNEAILLSDVETIYSTLAPGEMISKEEVLLQLINQTVLVSRAKEMGIEIEDWEISELMSQYKLLFGGEEQFNQILKETNLTEEILRRSLKNQLFISRLFEELYFPFIEIGDEEVEQFIALYFADEEDFELDNETLSEIRVFLKDMKKEGVFMEVLNEALMEAEIFLLYDFETGQKIEKKLVIEEVPEQPVIEPIVISPDEVEWVVVDEEEMEDEIEEEEEIKEEETVEEESEEEDEEEL
jgi:parvulin-like peptidyl-prolyl isomerase